MSEKRMPKRPTEWAGANPFYLLFVPGDEKPVEVVDLDRYQWQQDQGWIFRAVGELHLVRKSNEGVVLSVRATPGEQTYYVARHVGVMTAGGDQKGQTTVYGIGKKRTDGNQDNLWVLKWGQICGGQDVEYFATKGLKGGLDR